MPVYMVVDTKIKNPEAYEEYKVKAKQSLNLLAVNILLGVDIPVLQRLNCGHPLD